MINIFTLANDDQSLRFLGNIFGKVGGIIDKPGPPLLGDLFGVFNTSVFALAVMVIVYTTIMGTIASATEGQFLGQRMHSLWVPARSVMGIGGLIPVGGKFCAIQLLMLWIIVQGIGAADQLWTTALDYIKAGKPIKPPSGKVIPGLSQSMDNMFKSLVCSVEQQKANKQDPVMPVENPPIGTQHTINFGQGCGSISWNTGKPVYNSATGAKVKSIGKAQGDAYKEIISKMWPIANHFVESSITYCECASGKIDPTKDSCIANKKYYSCGDKNELRSAALDLWQSYIQPYAREDFYHESEDIYRADVYQAAAEGIQDGNIWGNIVAQGGVDKKGLLNSAMKSAFGSAFGKHDVSSAEKDAVFGLAADNGWIFAGTYYYYFALLNNKIQENYGSINLNQLTNISSLTMLAENMYDVLRIQQSAAGSDSGYGTKGGSGLMKPMWDLRYLVFEGLLKAVGGTNQEHPMITIQKLGRGILLAITIAWLAMLAILIAMTAAGGVMSSVSPGPFIVGNLLKYVSPAITAGLGALLVIGGIMAVYVPMLPYILFSFGAIGWMIATIETLIAAPLVALGVMYPGGQHEFFGAAQPAAMLTMNIFLRPSLMIMGMMAGMLLSYVVINFINLGFTGVVAQATHFSPGIIELIFYLILYTGLVITALNKCFSLIHVIPDRVLRWIGFQEQFGGGEAEAAGEIKGKMESGGSQVGGAERAISGKTQAGVDKKVGEGMAKRKADMGTSSGLSGGGDSGGGDDGGSDDSGGEDSGDSGDSGGSNQSGEGGSGGTDSNDGGLQSPDDPGQTPPGSGAGPA